MDMSGLFRVLFVTLAVACWAGAAQPQSKPQVTSLGPDFPKTEIFIGNSFYYYNNGLPGHVSLLEKAADPEHKLDYRATMVTIGGSGLDWPDVESYFRPNGIRASSLLQQNNAPFHPP